MTIQKLKDTGETATKPIHIVEKQTTVSGDSQIEKSSRRNKNRPPPRKKKRLVSRIKRSTM